MKTLVIMDSQGPDGLGADYRAAVPNCAIEGYEPARVAGHPCAPHGSQVAHLAGLIQVEPTRLVFLRIFDGPDAVAIPGGPAWALDQLERLDLPRGTVICRSWGAAPGVDFSAAMGALLYRDFVRRYTTLLDRNGWVDFGAAGNSDNNDPRDDIVYPQALMTERSNIIGSSDRAGRPSVFSGDGEGLQCLMWGERIMLRSYRGWATGSGTSFAAPKAAGACCALGLSDADWKRRIYHSPPDGWSEDEPWHRKYGWGNREHLWQSALLAVNPNLWPPCPVTSALLGDGGNGAPDFFEFREVRG